MNVLIPVSIVALIAIGSIVYVASITDFSSILNLGKSTSSGQDIATEKPPEVSQKSIFTCPEYYSETTRKLFPMVVSCVSDVQKCYDFCGTKAVNYYYVTENFEGCNINKDKLCCECDKKLYEEIHGAIKPTPISLTITASELQRAIDTSSEFKNLGKDAKFLISFFDGNGNPRSDLFFMVKENGKVTEGKEAYDVELQTGDYYIPQIKTTTDICSFIKRIKSMQEARVYLKINALEAYSKYGGLSSCVPFS